MYPDTEPMHVDDWLDLPAKDEGEAWAKEFLNHCRRPAVDKDYTWIANNPLFCTYKGERWKVLGASRMGDVWLARDFNKVNGYDLRVDVEGCSEWSRSPNP